MASDLGGFGDCLRGCLFVFNIIFWLIGIAVLAVGIWIVVDSENFTKTVLEHLNEEVQNSLGASSEESVRVLGYIAIALGGVILILGFLGCCGAWKKNTCLLGFFFVLLVLIVIILIVVAILVFVYSDKIKGWVEDAMEKEIKDEKEDGLMAYLHEKYDCCGIQDSVGGICTQNYPPTVSCGMDSRNCTTGCLDPMWEDFHSMKLGLGISLFVAGFLALVGAILSIILCFAIRSTERQYGPSSY